MEADVPRTPLAPRRAELLASYAADAEKENSAPALLSPVLCELRTPATKAPAADGVKRSPLRGKVRATRCARARR